MAKKVLSKMHSQNSATSPRVAASLQSDIVAQSHYSSCIHYLQWYLLYSKSTAWPKGVASDQALQIVYYLWVSMQAQAFSDCPLQKLNVYKLLSS